MHRKVTVQEIWKDIPGYEGHFQASSLGRIMNLKTGLEHIGQVTIHGYRLTKLITCAHMAHRLVALAFIPNPDGKEQVNHKDCNKLNNRVENLEWCTRLENMAHAIQNGLIVRGENHKSSKLNNKKVLQIRKLYTKGISESVLAPHFETHRKNIHDIVCGNTWKHITNGINLKQA